MSKIKKYYWDTCVFISYFKAENRKEPGVTDAIKYLVQKVYDGEIFIFTSAGIKAEILQCKMGDEAYQKCMDFLELDNIEIISTFDDVYTIAQEIRNFYADADPKCNISFSDAIHLASAVYREIEEFHTLDANEDCSKKKTIGLIPLSPKIANKYDLKICYPHFDTPDSDQTHIPYTQ